ncbi:HLA class II histocompatibility antigen, DRB1-11 beta chain-like, partial [Python bivittatus]|uniref:HLA class II histocompatibility antigen, DRB1-11 beta chain-like n=1 Tax=Python bivittatus TaxID=176946 RepID=A0A9F2REL5_PYTBI
MGPSSTGSWERWALDSLLTAAPPPPPPPAHFLHQWTCECHFFNGTQRVWFLKSFFYDRQEFVRFDSDLGRFVAITPLGQVDADKWNSNQDILLDVKAAIDYFCRHNYGVYNYKAAKRARLIGRR